MSLDYRMEAWLLTLWRPASLNPNCNTAQLDAPVMDVAWGDTRDKTYFSSWILSKASEQDTAGPKVVASSISRLWLSTRAVQNIILTNNVVTGIASFGNRLFWTNDASGRLHFA